MLSQNTLLDSITQAVEELRHLTLSDSQREELRRIDDELWDMIEETEKADDED